jgi:hypothetical protein
MRVGRAAPMGGGNGGEMAGREWEALFLERGRWCYGFRRIGVQGHFLGLDGHSNHPTCLYHSGSLSNIPRIILTDIENTERRVSACLVDGIDGLLVCS